MKAEDLLQSTNLDDIILGLTIIENPEENYNIIYDQLAFIIFDSYSFTIVHNEITKHYSTNINIDNTINACNSLNILVKDLRTKT